MLAVLRNPQLLAYLAGNLVSITGTWGQRVVVFWLAWDLTGSTSVLGLLAALDLLPSVLFAPVAGALADSRPAFRLTRNVQAISALPPLLMIGFLQFGEVTLPLLMLLTLMSGILNGLDHPLRLLIVGSIVPRNQVSGAVAANSIVFNIGRMIGPAIGGWVVSAGAPVAIFTTNTISFLIFSAVITFLKSQGDRPPATRSAQGNWGLAAWREVVSSFGASLLVVFCLFAGIAALIRPVFELLPGFVGDIAKDPEAAPEIFSLLTSAQGLGAMLGAFAISLLLARMKYQNVAMTAALTASLAALVFLASPQFHLSVAAIAVVSGAVLANGIATQVALQTRLPEKVRGRALSIYTMTFRGLPALGALLAGAVGELVPLRVVFALLAVALMCLTGWVFLSSSRRASKDEPDC